MDQWLESLKYVEEPTETIRDLKECLEEIRAAFRLHGNAKVICRNRIYYIWQESGCVQIKYTGKESYSLNGNPKKLNYTYPSARRLMRIEHYLKSPYAINKHSMLENLKKRRDHLLEKGRVADELAHIERIIKVHDSMKLIY